MTEQEVRRYLRQMKEEDSERAFHGFYNLCHDRLFRIAYYYVKRQDWAQEIVLDVFMRLWEQRLKSATLLKSQSVAAQTAKNAIFLVWTDFLPCVG